MIEKNVRVLGFSPSLIHTLPSQSSISQSFLFRELSLPGQTLRCISAGLSPVAA